MSAGNIKIIIIICQTVIYIFTAAQIVYLLQLGVTVSNFLDMLFVCIVQKHNAVYMKWAFVSSAAHYSLNQSREASSVFLLLSCTLIIIMHKQILCRRYVKFFLKWLYIIIFILFILIMGLMIIYTFLKNQIISLRSMSLLQERHQKQSQTSLNTLKVKSLKSPIG